MCFIVNQIIDASHDPEYLHKRVAEELMMLSFRDYAPFQTLMDQGRAYDSLLSDFDFYNDLIEQGVITPSKRLT